jgi:hypothetical protein
MIAIIECIHAHTWEPCVSVYATTTHHTYMDARVVSTASNVLRNISSKRLDMPGAYILDRAFTDPSHYYKANVRHVRSSLVT